MASQLICTLSGSAINDPVVCTLTGHIYERSSLTKYMELNGTCPISGKPLSEDLIVPLKCNVTGFSRPVKSTGVPSLIQGLQDQWDETALEIMQLKQHLQKVRKELSHTLYQQDAACRVIAR